MGTLPPTDELGLVLPDPGTGQPFSTAVQNGWFQTIDDAFTADRARLAPLEVVGKASGANPGIIPAGTAAQRDTYWGTPAAGAPGQAARLALAAKGARWFNTELGVEQRYFAATADGGPAILAKTTAGWKVTEAGLVPIAPTSVAGTGVTMDGNRVAFAGSAGIALNGVFTDSFEQYKILFRLVSSTADVNLSFRLRAAGSDYTGGAYSRQGVSGVAAAAAGSSQLNVSEWLVLNQVAAAGSLDMTVFNPADALQKSMQSEGYGITGGTQHFLKQGGLCGVLTAHDGFSINATTAGLMTGHLRVFGLGGQ